MVSKCPVNIRWLYDSFIKNERNFLFQANQADSGSMHDIQCIFHAKWNVYIRVSTNIRFSHERIFAILDLHERIFANIRHFTNIFANTRVSHIREYIREYSRIFANIHEYSRIYSRIFVNIHEYSRISVNEQHCG